MADISVIIPTYNRADLLPQAIESALAQTEVSLEVIVVDDGSTDETATVVQAYLADGRVRYVPQANQGRSAARNQGAALAQSDRLCFLDSDDRLLPSALAAHLAAVAQQSEVGLTLGGYRSLDERGQTAGERRPWEEGELTVAGWAFNCYGAQGAYAVQKSWFERVGGFDSYCEIAEDWDFFLRLAYADCPMAWVRQPVFEYRQHAGNSVRGLALHLQGSLRALDKLFRQPNLPPEVAALEQRARAWVYVVFTRRALAAKQPEAASEYLRSALKLDPDLTGRRKIELLETLLSSQSGLSDAGSDDRSAVLRHLPAELAVRPGDVRRAQARTEMARFFRAARQDRPAEAAEHLWLGLKLDPRWLANRGVLAFGLRALWGRTNGVK